MEQGRQNLVLGALTVALTVMCGPLAAQPTTPQQPSQQQAIPDAPRPQALPNLSPLTPVGPALPNAPTPVATKPAEPEVPTALPSTPQPTAEAEQEAQSDEKIAPPDCSKVTCITVYSNYVNVPFTVKDSKGHLVPGLTWRDVRIFENNVQQQPKLFTADPVALSVAVVIDQSVPFDTMTKINNSLSALQGAFSQYDEVAVFTYNNGVKMQTEFTAAQSARLGAVLNLSKGKGSEFTYVDNGPLSHNITRNGYEIDPNTSPNHNSTVTGFETPEREKHTLLDAILTAAQETAHAPKERRRIVYVITDGKEYGSKAKEKDVIKYLQANNVEVYATLVGDSAIPGLGFLDRMHLPGQMRDDIMPRIVATTGGETDPEYRQGGIEKSFARITEEVRTQYTIGYYTRMSPLNESKRTIEVRVLRPGLTVISKDGYYPNAHDSMPTPATNGKPTAVTSTTPPAASTTTAH